MHTETCVGLLTDSNLFVKQDYRARSGRRGLPESRPRKHYAELERENNELKKENEELNGKFGRCVLKLTDYCNIKNRLKSVVIKQKIQIERISKQKEDAFAKLKSLEMKKYPEILKETRMKLEKVEKEKNELVLELQKMKKETSLKVHRTTERLRETCLKLEQAEKENATLLLRVQKLYLYKRESIENLQSKVAVVPSFLNSQLQVMEYSDKQISEKINEFSAENLNTLTLQQVQQACQDSKEKQSLIAKNLKEQLAEHSKELRRRVWKKKKIEEEEEMQLPPTPSTTGRGCKDVDRISHEVSQVPLTETTFSEDELLMKVDMSYKICSYRSNLNFVPKNHFTGVTKKDLKLDIFKILNVYKRSRVNMKRITSLKKSTLENKKKDFLSNVVRKIYKKYIKISKERKTKNYMDCSNHKDCNIEEEKEQPLINGNNQDDYNIPEEARLIIDIDEESTETYGEELSATKMNSKGKSSTKYSRV